MSKNKLDAEENEILDAIETGRWELVKPTKSELAHYARVAKATLQKDQRMNIRISKADLNGIKARAADEGLAYQSLVTSIIHKYVSGRL